MSLRHPNLLRAITEVGRATMASRLGISLRDLRALERTAPDLWELRDMRRYAEAAGWDLHVTAVRRSDGHCERLSLGDVDSESEPEVGQ